MEGVLIDMNDEEIKKRFNEIVNEGGLDKKDALQSLKFLAEHISNSDILHDEVKNEVSIVLSEYQTQMKVIIIALTKARITRVSKMLEALEKAEDKIYEKIESATDDRVIIAYHSIITTSLRTIVDLANMSKALDIPITVNNFTQNNINVDNPFKTKDEKIDLRSKLSGLLKSIEQMPNDNK